jgi:diguanylate cyclase (GGDEF)-like protein
VLATDAAGAITFAEGSSLSALQRGATALDGRALRELFEPHAAALLALERAMAGLESMARVEIDDRVFELRISPSVQHNVTQGVACVLFDITERERATAQLDRLVLTDPLTALPNRRLFRDRLSQAIRSVERTRGPVSVLLLDLDHFKKVKDVHGHQAGDALIREVAVRIGKTLKTTDTLGRLGSDEFAVVLPGLDVEAASVLASRIVAALAQPFFIDGVTIEAPVSVGISAYPTDGFDADTLLRCADVAMFVAKRSGSGQQVYTLSLDEASLRRQSLATDLVRALAAAPAEFVLVYQPILEIATGELRGVEALARWEHPERGPISPLECVALAAASGFSVALSDRVLDLALADFVSWRNAGLTVPVSLNLSAGDFVDEGLPERVAVKLAEQGVRPAEIAFEINERALTADPSSSVVRLERLTSLGIAIVLDDFGGGGASISDLARLPLTMVKINAAIVRGIAAAHGPTPLARAAIGLAHALGYLAVAKGVEGSEPLECLRELGCDQAQGHYLARPMSASEILEWARGRTAAPAPATPIPVSAR